MGEEEFESRLSRPGADHDSEPGRREQQHSHHDYLTTTLARGLLGRVRATVLLACPESAGSTVVSTRHHL
jgi:hypothetical protein